MLTDYLVGPFILMYHSVDSSTDDPYSVSVEAFHDQIAWLAEYGFDVVPLSFLYQSLQIRNYSSLRKKIVLTFDDGYKNFITYALPLLLDSGSTATVFIVTDMLGGSSSWTKSGQHDQLMSEEDVCYIKDQGISLGSHTSTHANLPLLDKNELQRQLRDSHVKLSCLGESFYALSYPWGQWSNQVVDVVKSSKFVCALAVGEQTRLTAGNAFCLPRIIMRRDVSLERFKSLLVRTRMEMEICRRYRLLRETWFGACISKQYHKFVPRPPG